MAPDPKFVKLLEELKEATSQGRLEWSETVDENTFRVTLDPSANVRIGKGDDEYRDVFFAALTDRRGDVLETISSEDHDGLYFDLLHDLFEIASRHVKRIEDLLDRLIKVVKAKKS